MFPGSVLRLEVEPAPAAPLPASDRGLDPVLAVVILGAGAVVVVARGVVAWIRRGDR